MGDHQTVHPGDDLIYRERETAPSERVVFIQRQERKQSPRIEVEFKTAERAGSKAWVPGNRIYGPWSEVETFDAYMAGLDRLRADDDLTEVETSAVSQVYDLFLPEAVGEWDWSPVRYASRIHDRDALAKLLGVDLPVFLAPFATVEHDGDVLASANASSAIAEALCKANPADVVDWALGEEERRREWTERGKPVGADGERRGTSAEWEWLLYRDSYRPLYEMMRSWAGHRAATAHERRVAAEAEVHRLETLAADLIDDLRGSKPHSAEAFEERLRRERIMPETIRPLVERPLDPSEIPVRVEYRARRRWSS